MTSKSTRNKIVTTGPRVGNHTSQLVVLIENHAVSTGRAATVDRPRAQNWPLIVRARHRKVEAFVVVVDVRVVVAADRLAAGVLLVPGGLGAGHGAGGVADTATGVGACTGVKGLRKRQGALDKQKGGKGDQLGDG